MLGQIRRVLLPFRPFHPFFSISLIALTLTACAGRPPVGEMAGAGVAISAAKAAGAEERAPVEFILAKYLFDESVRDVESSRYGRARANAVEAKRVALEAEDLAWRAGRQAVLKSRRAAEKGDPASRSALAAAILRPAKPDKKNGGGSPKAPRPDARHRVVQGESLWMISGYARVYNDPFKWPLLYEANRERIADPDLIHPGQVLRIERKPSPPAVSAAVLRARRRGSWSLWDGK